MDRAMRDVMFHASREVMDRLRRNDVSGILPDMKEGFCQGKSRSLSIKAFVHSWVV